MKKNNDINFGKDRNCDIWEKYKNSRNPNKCFTWY